MSPGPARAGPASALRGEFPAYLIDAAPIKRCNNLCTLHTDFEENYSAPTLLSSTHMAHINLAEIDPLTSRIIACGVEVHRRLGPGLLESVYHVCLGYELRNAGLAVVENMTVPVSYKDLRFVCALKADFLVNDTVIVEIKSVADIAPVHEAQLLTYLRLTNRPVGLLMNFNVPVLKEGIRRKLNARTNASESSVSPSL